ncbi:hypothetical protein [Sulfolobus tengchongensis spindle-shaped virus 4]|nr:hypothetical protein [Sulfolobus tengchongensis spindle-shaped virus 4]
MVENVTQIPAPVNAGAKDNEIYIKSIIKQLHTTIRREDYLGKSLNNLTAAANQLGGQEVLYIIDVYLYRVATERQRAREEIKHMYNILKRKKHITDRTRARLAIHAANLMRSLSVIDAIYATTCQINSIYYNEQAECTSTTNKLAALVFFAKELLLSL